MSKQRAVVVPKPWGWDAYIPGWGIIALIDVGTKRKPGPSKEAAIKAVRSYVPRIAVDFPGG